MLRQNLALFLVCLTTTVFSQTLFYARAITELPIKPSTADNISIVIQGDLSSTNSAISNTSFRITGFEINITLDCTTEQGGSSVLKPHEETLVLGPLPPGDYHINLWGKGMEDVIQDTTDHYFQVRDPQAANSTVVQIDPTYDLSVDPDSGFVQITQNSSGAGMDLIQIIDMQGKVVMERSLNKERSVKLTLPEGKRGIFLVSVKCGDYVWSDIFSRPKQVN